MKSVWKDTLWDLSPAYVKKHPGVHAFLTMVSQESKEISASWPLSLSKVFYDYFSKYIVINLQRQSIAGTFKKKK